jgi:glutamate-1-semialdehyde 2,1-aminomutase
MELLAPLGPVYQAGTLSGNPVAVAAGLETLKILKSENPYPSLARLAGTLTQELQERAGRWKISAQVRCVGSMFTFFFCGLPISDYETAKRSDVRAYGRFFNSLLDGGVYFPPAQFETAFLSTAHTAADVENTIRAAEKFFRR